MNRSPVERGSRTTRCFARIGTAAATVFAAACASSGPSAADLGPGAPGMAGDDGARMEEVNRRILAATPSDAREPGSFEGYRVGPNDLIRVDVFGAETFSGDYRVEDGGEIAFPLLGSVDAAGRTPRELESLLEDRLRETYMRDPHVAIQVVEVESQGVSVIGAVQSPGVYQIRGQSTLLQVLAMAQGLTEGAGTDVFVVRPAASRTRPGNDVAPAGDNGVAEVTTVSADSLAALGFEAPPGMPDGRILQVDLGALLESGRTTENIVVLPGDVVQVRPAGMIYVVGEVNQPGGFSMPTGSGITALQALAMAEGLGRTAKASGSVIVRQTENGERLEIPVDLEAVLEGEEPPPPLEPRDVLFVPNNRSKAVALGVLGAVVSMFTFRGLFY